MRLPSPLLTYVNPTNILLRYAAYSWHAVVESGFNLVGVLGRLHTALQSLRSLYIENVLRRVYYLRIQHIR